MLTLAAPDESVAAFSDPIWVENKNTIQIVSGRGNPNKNKHRQRKWYLDVVIGSMVERRLPEQ
jgi:hypothetical protein